MARHWSAFRTQHQIAGGSLTVAGGVLVIRDAVLSAPFSPRRDTAFERCHLQAVVSAGVAHDLRVKQMWW